VLEQLHFLAIALGLQEELPGSHQLFIKVDWGIQHYWLAYWDLSIGVLQVDILVVPGSPRLTNFLRGCRLCSMDVLYGCLFVDAFQIFHFELGPG
jgi:hypothetical protein